MPYFPRQNGPELQQWSGSAGYTVIYRNSDAKTLAKVRRYQADVRASTPGWTTRLDLGHEGVIRLHVYPKTEVLTSLTSREFAYAS